MNEMCLTFTNENDAKEVVKLLNRNGYDAYFFKGDYVYEVRYSETS